MPRKVADAVAAKITAETGHEFQGRTGFQKMRPRGGTAVRPLDALQKKALSEMKSRRYIYNVSPIFSHKRRAANLGFFISKRKEDARYSEALVILPASVRYVVKGQGVAEPVITLADEMARDILGAYDNPRAANDDLRKAGCFSTERPIENLSAEERETILFEAEEQHRQHCIRKVFQGDELWNDPKMRTNVIEVHRKCALFLQSLDPTSHEFDREWVAKRGQKPGPVKVECKFCGNENKPGLAVCPNCKNILDKKQYEKLAAS